MNRFIRSFKLLSLFTIIVLNGTSVFGLCIKASKANLRSGPGTTYAKTWEVYKYMPLRRVKRAGSWYNVKDVDGDSHWVHKNLITSRYKCATVKVSKANLRNKPRSGRVTSRAEKYEAFRVLKFKNGWVNVLDEVGDKYWVFRKLVWIN